MANLTQDKNKYPYLLMIVRDMVSAETMQSAKGLLWLSYKGKGIRESGPASRKTGWIMIDHSRGPRI